MLVCKHGICKNGDVRRSSVLEIKAALLRAINTFGERFGPCQPAVSFRHLRIVSMSKDHRISLFLRETTPSSMAASRFKYNT